MLTATAALSVAMGSTQSAYDHVDSNKKDADIWRPSYAMGSMACVGLSPDSELYKKRTMSIRLLHAVMQAMQPTPSHIRSPPTNIALKIDCIRHPSFDPSSSSSCSLPPPIFYFPADASLFLSTLAPCSSHSITLPVLSTRNDFLKSHVKVVSHVVGALRRPPSEHDLRIYMTAPNCVRFKRPPMHAHPDDMMTTESNGLSTRLQAPTRHDVPGVPGSFLLCNVLTAEECAQFILAAEHIGYIPDAVDGIDNVQWLADGTILDTIYSRCSHLLPAHIDGHALGGINAKLRLFR